MFRKYVTTTAYRVSWNIFKFVKKLKSHLKRVGDGPVVRVRQGELRGRCFETKNGFKINSFQGVPYARPPVGKLRFQAPQPAEPWEGIRNATEDGSECSQHDLFLNMFRGSEDCLYMNIHTPADPSHGPYPVIVFVHGGAFVMHSGATDFFGPDLLVERGVILITFNYRLNALGFLTLETENMPGNAGLKDQVAALRWVRDNISAFGGDPNNVTLAGESAGGASVHYLMVSDSSKGLFHKAISQSGSALNPWAVQVTPRERALATCSVLGHPTTDLDDAFQFLQSAPAMDLVRAQAKIWTNEDKRRVLGMVMVPSIEKEYPGVEPFITESVLERLQKGQFHNVPYITGYNSSEGTLFVDLSRKSLFTDMDRDFERMIPDFINVERGSAQSEELASKIRKYYFSDAPITKSSANEFARIAGDLQFVYGIRQTVQIQSSLSTAPTWMYRFSHDIYSMFKFLLGVDVPGVSHGDDIIYLFKMSMMMNLPKDKAFQTTTNRFVQMWTDFAKTSDPTPVTSDLIPIRWEPATKNKLNFLEFGEELEMKQNPEEEHMAFWEEQIKTYHRPEPANVDNTTNT